MDNGEQAACIVINLGNLSKMVPGLSTHPIFLIILHQAEELQKNLEERS